MRRPPRRPRMRRRRRLVSSRSSGPSPGHNRGDPPLPPRREEASNHAISLDGATRRSLAVLLLAPYTLGAWLGDGSSNHATIYSDDPQVVEMIAADGYEVNRHPAPFAYGISARVPRVADTRRACALCERPFAPRLAGRRFCSRDRAQVARGTSERNPCPPACARCGGPLGAQARVMLCGPCVRASNPNSILRLLGLLGNKHIPKSVPASVRAAASCAACRTPGRGRLRDSPWRSQFRFDKRAPRQGRSRAAAVSLGYRATLVAKRATLNGRDCGPAYRVSFTTSDDVFRLERKRKLLQQRLSRHNAPAHALSLRR